MKVMNFGGQATAVERGLILARDVVSETAAFRPKRLSRKTGHLGLISGY